MNFTVSLNQNSEFRRVYSRGKSLATPLVVLYCRRNGTKLNRFGITVGAKIGHAVQRNRVRRRLREIYRLGEGRFSPGWDIVAVARTRAVGASYWELDEAFYHAAAKLDLLKSPQGEARK